MIPPIPKEVDLKKFISEILKQPPVKKDKPEKEQ